MKKPGTLLFFVAVFLGLLFTLFVVFLVPKVIQNQKLEQRGRDLDGEIKKIKLENFKLENELRLLREDAVYLEKVAREKFNKAREGEIVYKVVREGEAVKQRQ